MLKFCSLYSGSSGYSLLLQTDKSNILIDAGVSAKKIETALCSININPTDINAILITHEHSDHIQGLGTLSKKFNIPVYANEKTWQYLPKDKISKENQNIFCISSFFEIQDLKILPFSIPHDAIDPCGFNIYHGNTKISIATDIGHIDSNILCQLQNSSFVMLESNYDPNILKCSSYPYNLKMRIAGPNGHLSNSTAGKTIAKLVNTGLKSVMLGHLSKENNFPELAYKTVIDELNSQNIDENILKLSIAERFKPSNIISIA